MCHLVLVGSTLLHVRKNGCTTEQSSGTNGTSLDGSGESRRAAAGGLGVAGGVVTNGTGVRGEARGDGVVSGGQSLVGGSGRGDVGSVGDVAAGRSAGESDVGLVVGLGTVGGGVVAGREDAVENVQDSVGDEDVCGNDAGTVHEDLAVDDGDGDVTTTESRDGGVGQRAAVCHGAVDDVVLQDRGSFLGSEVAQGRADVLERSVVGGEDGQVWCRVDGLGEVCGVDCTKESTQTSFLSDDADVRRDSKEAVDDMDHTAVECNVLSIISFLVNV